MKSITLNKKQAVALKDVLTNWIHMIDDNTWTFRAESGDPTDPRMTPCIDRIINQLSFDMGASRHSLATTLKDK